MELWLLGDVVLEYILFSSTEGPIPHPLAGALSTTVIKRDYENAKSAVLAPLAKHAFFAD